MGCDKECGGCKGQPESGPVDLQEMIQEFRTLMKVPQTDPSDIQSMTMLMNVFTEKFEAFFNACGFTFDEEGNPTLPEVVVADQQEMMDNMVSMAYILIDWSLAYGWDFNKNFKKAHNKAVAAFTIQTMGMDPQTVEVVEPSALNNTEE